MGGLRVSITIVALLLLAGCERGAREESGKVAGAGAPASTLPAGCAPASRAPAEIRFGATPYIGSEAIEKHFGPILAYLSKETGVPFRLVTSKSYEQLLALLEAGEVDVASLSPLVYVRARRRLPCLQLLLTQVTQGSPYYSGYIVVRADSGLHSFGDLAGKRIAFASPNSASGDLFPRAFVHSLGEVPEEFFSKIEYKGDHLTALNALLDGEVEAAATFSAFIRPAREGGLEVGNLRVLAVTGRIPYDAICAGPQLPPAVAEQVRDALYRLNTTREAGRRVLNHVVDMNGWVMTDDSVYDSVRETLELVEGGGR
jgi:phosphonate transport system substrate-binding protein